MKEKMPGDEKSFEEPVKEEREENEELNFKEMRRLLDEELLKAVDDKSYRKMVALQETKELLNDVWAQEKFMKSNTRESKSANLEEALAKEGITMNKVTISDEAPKPWGNYDESKGFVSVIYNGPEGVLYKCCDVVYYTVEEIYDEPRATMEWYVLVKKEQ